MWKSSRSKFVFLSAALLLSGSPLLWAAGQITSITILGLDNNPSFTAGVATNTPTTTIDIITIASDTNPSPNPDAGQVVQLSLLVNGVVLDNAIYPSSFTTTGANVFNGGNASLPLTFFPAGTTIALRAHYGSITTDSNSFTVVAGSATKVVVYGPGMSHAPGTNPTLTTGVSGTFTPQEPNQAFQITVVLTDNQFNKVTRNDTVSFTSTDLIDLPSPGALTNGVGTFNVTITGARVTRTILVNDTSTTTVAAGSLDVTTAGPPAKELFPFPSPFNPHERDLTFRFRLSEPKDCEITVINLFGEKVWEKSVSGNIGFNDVTWNGRNDKGAVVAAGVYYGMLKVGGSLESKKRFGVIK